MAPPVIVWFRQDLRLTDNPALTKAVASGKPVIPLYILDDEAPGQWRMGGASRWWLHHSLTALGADLKKLGATLVLRSGNAGQALASLIDETAADTVCWNRCYEPFHIARDTQIKSDLTGSGVTVHSSNASLLFEPWQVKTQAGDPFKVFSPFWRACQAAGIDAETSPAPVEIKSPRTRPASDDLDSWQLTPSKPDWAAGFSNHWTPGEAGAAEKLTDFLDGAIGDYKDGRNRPDQLSTSMLSPHLHFGEIGPRQIVRAVWDQSARSPKLTGQADKFLSEIGWREFSYHLLHQFPDLPERCFRADFASFPWASNPEGLKAWQRGQTGIPIVDAGMRQLWQTGWMHNRVRMVVASFLVKHLLVSWQDGEAWFWDTLVDADLANNAASWQWVAGCGADAAPYFRIFNPILQGEKFDPDGAYVKAWVPELATMPSSHIHKPWEAPAAMLKSAGVQLGDTYPRPIIDLQSGRDRALAAFASLKSAA